MSYEMPAADAATRLGVKQATLYAYVSRGVLSRGRGPDGRTSLFDPGEVEQLARRGRPRRQAGAADIVIESQITEISGNQLRYRGRDVIGLAATRSFENVAELLWTGAFPHPAPSWQATGTALAVGQAAQAVLPPQTLPLERLQVIVPAIAATDPLRLELDPAAVIAAARAMIAAMVHCLPAAAAPAAPAALASKAPSVPLASSGPPDCAAGANGTVAPRLWTRLCARRPAPALLRALSTALVLLADHELAASTLAARAAASVRGDPYAVVATGLGAVSGALHGGSSLGAESLLAAARDPADVPRVVAELRRRGEKVPGFGHFVYRTGDPRAIALLDLIRHAAPKSGQLAIAEAVLAEMRRKSLPEPNIDFALATLARVAGMVRGAGETIFAVARTAGWIAHALEAYTTAPIRPRAVYTGPVPADS